MCQVSVQVARTFACFWPRRGEGGSCSTVTVLAGRDKLLCTDFNRTRKSFFLVFLGLDDQNVSLFRFIYLFIYKNQQHYILGKPTDGFPLPVPFLKFNSPSYPLVINATPASPQTEYILQSHRIPNPLILEYIHIKL